jgi:hypothetical protein
MSRTLSSAAATGATGNTVTVGRVPGVYEMPTLTPPGTAAPLSCARSAVGTATVTTIATSSPALTARSSD